MSPHAERPPGHLAPGHNATPPRTFCPSANCPPLVQNVSPHSLYWGEHMGERWKEKVSLNCQG